MTLEQIQNRLSSYQPQLLGQQKKYAVLLPLIELNNQLHILYQVRSQTVSQPGDVAFPGGQVEKEETFQEAAKRECCEELQIRPGQIKIIGEIDYIVKPSAIIHCFVGFIQVKTLDEITPNPDEVDYLFTLPISDLQKTKVTFYPSKQKISLDEDFPYDRIPGGKQYPFQTFSHQIPFFLDLHPTIWGFTAQMTHRFLKIMEEVRF